MDSLYGAEVRYVDVLVHHHEVVGDSRIDVDGAFFDTAVLKGVDEVVENVTMYCSQAVEVAKANMAALVN